MKKQPLISIITPTYNHEEFIGRCIESVLAQTYPNWEQIIIDDGSTDKTRDIITQYKDERINYIRQDNVGIWRLGKTYNKALQISRGELIAVLEGDDFWPADKLEKQSPAFKRKEVVLSWGKAVKFKEAYYSSNFLNAIQRSMDPTTIKWKYKLGIKDSNNSLKLYLGCGGRHFEGYINIDFRKTGATDLVCDIKNLPHPDNSVELIETYHVIEHIPRHDLPRALKEWYRIIVPGGKLIIECPNFDEAVKEYIKGNEKRLDSIFGLQRFPGDTHMFGYNFKRLKKILEISGFKDIQKKEPQDSHTKVEPCLRVECVKGDKT